jgi:hypothetical protein
MDAPVLWEQSLRRVLTDLLPGCKCVTHTCDIDSNEDHELHPAASDANTPRSENT